MSGDMTGMVHFSEEFSPEILRYAKEKAFKSYIFVEITRNRAGSKHTGCCTYCDGQFSVKGLKHKTEAICPLCGRKATVIMTWYGRSKMIDDAYFVYYEKSHIDPKTIVARGIYAVKDYRESFKKVMTHMKTQALYVFTMGKPSMYERYAWFTRSDGKNTIETGSFSRCASVYSALRYYWNRNVFADYSRESIAEAVQGTPFQYSTWDRYNYLDMTTFFEMYSKYPCVEYLTKCGFGDCVKDKLCNRNTYGAINWLGKTFNKVLRLSKNQLRTLKAFGEPIDSFRLKLYQLSIKDGSNLTLKEIDKIENALCSMRFREFQKIIKYSSIRQVFNYFTRQYELSQRSKKNWYYSTSSVGIDYRDYLDDCLTLEMDMKSDSVLFPKNLHRAHENTTKQVKLKADDLLNQKISKRYNELLKKFVFETDGLFIRPAASSQELIDEGKALNHCVGRYADSYANGSTNILLIRKASQPDKPYYTMEATNDNRILQTRGKNNCTMNSEVVQFVEKFRAKISTKKSDNRIKIMVPA